MYAHILCAIHFEYLRHERIIKKNKNKTKKSHQPNRRKKMVAFDFGAQCFTSIYAYFEPIEPRHDIDWARKSHSFVVGRHTVDSTLFLLLLHSSISLTIHVQSISFAVCFCFYRCCGLNAISCGYACRFDFYHIWLHSMICWPKERWKRKPLQIKRTLLFMLQFDCIVLKLQRNIDRAKKESKAKSTTTRKRWRKKNWWKNSFW